MPGDVSSRNILASARFPWNVSAAEGAAQAADPDPHVQASSNAENEDGNLPWLDVVFDVVLDIHGFMKVLIRISPVRNVKIPVIVNNNASGFIIISIEKTGDEVAHGIFLTGLVVALVRVCVVGIVVLVALSSSTIELFTNFVDCVSIIALVIIVGILLKWTKQAKMLDKTSKIYKQAFTKDKLTPSAQDVHSLGK